MQNVKTLGKCDLEDYKSVLDESLHNDLHSMAEKLKGVRVCHINATSYGGGVAEILHQEIPLARSLGLSFDWKVIKAPDEFYNVTKKIHNALQGDKEIRISTKEWSLYKDCNVKFSKKFNPNDYDVVFIHDPQPAMLIDCLGKGNAKWIWRCHLDLSSPNKDVEKYFKKFIDLYDHYIFTLPKYVFKGLKGGISTVLPAIDPLSDKNKIITRGEAEKYVKKFGIDTKKPLITQVSRFDPWKDPKGVVDAYRIAKKKIPGLQLALAASMADDDPEGEIILNEVKMYTIDDKDVYFLINLNKKYGDISINALQTYSDIILQKSIREGFGLTVTEALWKGTPVIGGDVGGIPQQIKNGVDGFLVNGIEECAEKIIALMQDKLLRKKMGVEGHEHIRKNFLLPRLLLDELRIIEKVRKAKDTRIKKALKAKVPTAVVFFFILLTTIGLPWSVFSFQRNQELFSLHQEKPSALSILGDITLLHKKLGEDLDIKNDLNEIEQFILNNEYELALYESSLVVSKIHGEKIRLVEERKAKEREEEELRQLAMQTEGPSFAEASEGKQRYEVLGARLEVQTETFGYSAEGRAITGNVFGIGNETILLFGAIHGHEKGTKTLLDTFINELKANPSLVGANKKVIIIPLLNPDGYHRDLWKVNANNVNLNLNFETTDWEQYGGDSNLFAGSEPWTESESRIIRDLVAQYNVQRMITVHARGNLVNPEYGHGPSEDLARWYASVSGYRYMNDPSWYYHGTATRWFVEKYGRPAVTVELSDYNSSDWGKNEKALLELIK